MKRIKASLKRLFDIIKKPVMKILPGHLAFFLILSIISLLVIVGFIASLFNISIDTMINFITTTLPNEVSDLLVPLMSGKDIDMNIFIFTVIGLVVASNGPYAIILASNILYDVKDNDSIKDRIKAIIMTILLVSILLFIMIVLAYGSHIVNLLLSLKALAKLKTEIYYIYLAIKWPIGFLILFFNIKLLYTMAPDKNIKSKTVNRGTMFTSLGWIIATAIYSYYIGNIANYNLYYGTLSNIIILMLWLYIIGYIFVIGIAINSDYYNKLEKIEDNK